MAWTPTVDKSAGSVLTATDYNQQVLGNLNDLRGRDGLVFISRLTVTNTTSGSLNSVFTSDFLNYRIVINATGAESGVQTVGIRLRAGSDNSSSNYQYRRHGVVGGASYTDSPATTTSFDAVFGANGLGAATFVGDILQPQATARTGISGLALVIQSTDLFTLHYGGVMTVTTSYDGVTLLSGSNFTATMDVYGYGK